MGVFDEGLGLQSETADPARRRGWLSKLASVGAEDEDTEQASGSDRQPRLAQLMNQASGISSDGMSTDAQSGDHIPNPRQIGYEEWRHPTSDQTSPGSRILRDADAYESQGAPADIDPGMSMKMPSGTRDVDPGMTMKLPGGYRDPDPGMSIRPNRLLSDAAQSSAAPSQSAPTSTAGPRLIDRINDDGASRNLDPSTADLESRVATAAAPQYRPVAQDDHTAEMESRYNQLGQQPQRGRLASILNKLATIASPRYERYQENQQRNAITERDSLLPQITAEKRMEEQERNLDTRANETEYGENLRNQRLIDAMNAKGPEHMDTGAGPLQFNPQTRQWEQISVGGQPVGPKETKPDSPEQQDIDNYLKQGFSLPEAIRKSAADRQPPQRPPQVNLIVPGLMEPRPYKQCVLDRRFPPEP